MAGAVVLSLIVVAASFTLSFNALSELGAMSGAIPPRLTPLLPVVVDVFILQATWCALLSTRRGDAAGKRYHFSMLALFSATSVAGNAAHAVLVADQGAHALLAVAIAIVAPGALLASIHGLVMHVWTGSEQPHADAAQSGARGDAEQPAQQVDGEPRAPHAQVRVSELTSSPDVSPELGSDTPSIVDFKRLDEQITDEDRDLARLVCVRGGVKYGKQAERELAVARALVCERLNAPKEDAAIFIGVHRTTISRWLAVASECMSSQRTHTDPAVHARLEDRELVDAH